MSIPIIDKVIGLSEELFEWVNDAPTRRRSAVIRSADELIKRLNWIFNEETDSNFDDYKKDIKHYWEQYKVRRKRLR